MSEGVLKILWRRGNEKKSTEQCGEMRLYVAELKKRDVYVCGVLLNDPFRVWTIALFS